MHDVSTQLAAVSLVSFAAVAALIPLISDTDISRVVARTGARGETTRSTLAFLVVEVVAACILFAGGVRVHLVNDAVDVILTVAWLVALANSFSELDSAIEGAASVVASALAVGVTVAAAL